MWIAALAVLSPALVAFAPSESDPAPRAPLAKVVFLGASVTAGFNAKLDFRLDGEPVSTSFDLAAVAEAAAGEDAGTFVSRGDAFFFGAPQAYGPKLLKAALAEDPTTIVGIDFLFWFAYGGADHEGQKIESPEQRFAKLEAGLALLEDVECTLVLGDLPDMSAAIGTMLLPSYVPGPETLAVLNGKLHEWADARENVLVIPLAATVDAMHADREIEIGGYTWPAGSRERLLHEDNLHTTAVGQVALVQLLARALDEAGLVEADAFDLDPAVVVPRLEERAVLAARAKREAAKKGTPVPAGE